MVSRRHTACKSEVRIAILRQSLVVLHACFRELIKPAAGRWYSTTSGQRQARESTAVADKPMWGRQHGVIQADGRPDGLLEPYCEQADHFVSKQSTNAVAPSPLRCHTGHGLSLMEFLLPTECLLWPDMPQGATKNSGMSGLGTRIVQAFDLPSRSADWVNFRSRSGLHFQFCFTIV